MQKKNMQGCYIRTRIIITYIPVYTYIHTYIHTYMAEGDYAGMLRLYNEWEAAGGVRRGLNWAKQNYVHSRAMCRAYDVREQLVQIMQRFDMPIIKGSR